MDDMVCYAEANDQRYYYFAHDDDDAGENPEIVSKYLLCVCGRHLHFGGKDTLLG